MYTEYLSRNIRRRKIITAAVISILTIILFTLVFNTVYSPDLYFINLGPNEDVSCHYARDGDALPPIDARFFPASNSIFFHETACKGRLDSKQTCSIESAARTHPDWEIHVLFSSPINELSFGDVNIELLRLLKNVHFSRVHLIDYAKGTPIEDLVSGGALNRTRWPVSHTSDVLRYLTLYKWGGIYLDLDVVVAKPLGGLKRNWAARENDEVVAAGALSFYRDSLGTLVADAAVRTLAETFRGDVRGQNGPSVVTNVLREICTTDDVTRMTADKCLGFEVYPPTLFYPLSPDQPEEFFQPGVLDISAEAYLYHMRNKHTHELQVSKNSPYAKLAKRYCPIVYETYRNMFGFEVYNPEVLYPIHWTEKDSYFVPGDFPQEKVDKAYTHHLWNKLSHYMAVETDSPFDKLAKKHCPTIRNTFGEHFGS